mgnify:CR=1 FL=1
MSTSSNELERGTNWAAEFAFYTGRHVEQKELDEDEEEEEPTERDWLINAATSNPMDEMYDDYA